MREWLEIVISLKLL